MPSSSATSSDSSENLESMASKKAGVKEWERDGGGVAEGKKWTEMVFGFMSILKRNGGGTVEW